MGEQNSWPENSAAGTSGMSLLTLPEPTGGSGRSHTQHKEQSRQISAAFQRLLSKATVTLSVQAEGSRIGF